MSDMNIDNILRAWVAADEEVREVIENQAPDLHKALEEALYGDGLVPRAVVWAAQLLPPVDREWCHTLALQLAAQLKERWKLAPTDWMTWKVIPEPQGKVSLTISHHSGNYALGVYHRESLVKTLRDALALPTI